MRKLILTDVDGVLLEYFNAFAEYHSIEPVTENHHKDLSEALGIPLHTVDKMINDFNHSDSYDNLSPLPHAVKYVERLKNEGFNFHIITSCGESETIFQKRKDNLLRHFPFDFENGDKLSILEYSDSKYRFLKEYEGSDLVWIEDSIKNYEIGVTLGLDSYLFPNTFNDGDTRDNIHRQTMHDWRSMYYRIKSKYRG